MNGAPDDRYDSYISPAIEGWTVGEPRSNPVRDKSFQFALEIIELNRALVKEHEFVISRQPMRSGTAVGAIIEEAIGARAGKISSTK